MAPDTTARNKQVVTDILSGMSAEKCAKRHAITVPSVGGIIRQMLALLEAHTDYTAGVSSAADFLAAHKDTILKYLAEPLPSITLASHTHHVLTRLFGKFYARAPEAIVARWPEVKDAFNFRQQRLLKDLKAWLATLGYFLEDYLSPELEAFAYQQLAKTFEGLNTEQGALAIKVQRSNLSWGTLMIETTLTQGQHTAKRLWRLELLPEQK